jgi:hypothetical protein
MQAFVTLSDDEEIVLGIFVLLQLIVYTLLRCLESPLTPTAQTRKARAWKLSTCVSVYYGFFLGPLYVYQLSSALLTGADAVANLLAVEQSYGRTGCLYMLSFLFADFGLGLIDYREQMRIDTGYIHHTAYVFILCYALSRGFTQYFVVLAIAEVPTFLLAVGSIFPSLRQDLLFGVTFFLSRILWFAVVLGVCMVPGYNKIVSWHSLNLPSIRPFQPPHPSQPPQL